MKNSEYRYMLTQKVEVLLSFCDNKHILSFNRLDDDLKTCFQCINKTEYLILSVLIVNLSKSTPLQAIKAHLEQHNCVLENQSIINSINNLRRKVTPSLVRVDADVVFIKNINKKGYHLEYTNKTNKQTNKQTNKTILNKIKLKAKDSFLARRTLTTSMITTLIVLMVNTSHVLDRFKTHSIDAHKIAKSIVNNAHSCDNHEMSNILSNSINMRTGIITFLNGEKCLVKTAHVQSISDEAFKNIIYKLKLKHIPVTYNINGIEFIGFINKSSVVETYRLPNLMDGFSFNQMVYLNSIYMHDNLVFENSNHGNYKKNFFTFHYNGYAQSSAEFGISLNDSVYNLVFFHLIISLFFTFFHCLNSRFNPYKARS